MNPPRSGPSWLARNPTLILAILITLSLVLRLAYFSQMSRGPCVWLHQWAESDMHFFHTWASSIAQGDWLNARGLHPDTSWTQEVAKQYFAEHPDKLKEYAGPSGDPRAASRALWDHWFGGKKFFQDPLYVYLVALTYAALGPNILAVFAWQLALGIGSIILMWWLTRRIFGDLVALVAAVLMAGCWLFLAYEMVLLRDTLAVFTGLALITLTGAAWDRRSAALWFATGLASGLGLLVRIIYAPLALGAFCGLAFNRDEPRPRRVRFAASFAAGVLVCLAPVAARNMAVGVSPLSLTGEGSLAMAATNARASLNQHGWVLNIPSLARIFGESDGRLLPSIRATLRTHTGPGSYLRLMRRKLVAMWHWYEAPDNMNVYYFRLHAEVLRWLPVDFALIAPFGVFGLVIGARVGGVRSLPLYLLAATCALFLLAFYTVSRYRLLFLAALVPFAALAMVRMVEGIRGRKPWWGAAAAACLALALYRAPGPATLIRPVDHIVPYLVHYGPLADAAEQRGDWAQSVRILEEALRYLPAAPAGGATVTREARALQEHAAVIQARRAAALRKLTGGA